MSATARTHTQEVAEILKHLAGNGHDISEQQTRWLAEMQWIHTHPEEAQRELDWELRICSRINGSILSIHHPYLNCPLGVAQPIEKINEGFRDMKSRIEGYLRSGQAEMALILVSSPYRLQVLHEWLVRDKVDPRSAGYRSALCDAWMHTELPYQYNKGLVRKLFRAAGWFTDHDENFEDFPPRPEQPLTLYRGVSERYKRERTGFSWTANPERAVWFAKRWSHKGPGAVYELEVPPENMLACLIGRGEAEYIVDCKGLTPVRVDTDELSGRPEVAGIHAAADGE